LINKSGDSEFIIGKVWQSLDRPKWKNPLFNQIVPTAEDLDEVDAKTKFKATEHLINLMTVKLPPDSRYWKTLPREVGDNEWGDYNVHMEKEGQPSRDHFGSGTRLEGGLKVRLKVYDYPLNLDALPKHVAQSVLEGYRITHVGVLTEILGSHLLLATLQRFVCFTSQLKPFLLYGFGISNTDPDRIILISLAVVGIWMPSSTRAYARIHPSTSQSLGTST
jgi:hypothetical protein